MEIKKQFNEMTLNEIISYIKNKDRYTNFNTLGLYRAIVESTKMSLEEKLELRTFAHGIFQKSFDFLQLKDPKTYMEVSTLGEEKTKADERQLWRNVVAYQQKMIDEKKVSHRNFGIYSIHDCGYETCPYNGIMIHRGSRLAESNMHFETDKNQTVGYVKSERRKKDRKNEKLIIKDELESLD
jgi:hypothetical protein